LDNWRKEAAPRVQKQIEQILTPQQRQTYKDLQLSVNTWCALVGPTEDAKLDLTEAQSKQLRSLRDEYWGKMKHKFREDDDRILAVLTPQQRAKLREVAIGPLGIDYEAIMTVCVEGNDDPILIYDLAPYPDFSKEDVQKELKLTAMQQAQVQELLGDSSTVTEKLLRDLLKLSPDERNARQNTEVQRVGRISDWPGLSAEELAKKRVELEEQEKKYRRTLWSERQGQPLMQMTVALRKQFEAILTPEQLAAYQDMFVQKVIQMVANDFIIRRQIGVTKEQEVKLHQSTPMPSVGNVWLSQRDLGKRMWELLTPAQRDKLPQRMD
jgi:Spy/CpxP family protein refolding chaperone